MRKEIKKQLQTIMDQAVKDNQIAGMNMMVIKDDVIHGNLERQ